MESPSPPTKKVDTKTSQTRTYPEPFVVAGQMEHKKTLILLHGRGSHGEKFGRELLGHEILQKALPHTKLIFPTAKGRRARWYKRTAIKQWFDNVPIDEQDNIDVSLAQEAWQLEGLKQTREFLNVIVDEEVGSLGAKSVFIGGLSQGCAMRLHFFLSYEGRSSNREGGGSLGGYVGMSGWLPFARDVQRILSPQDPGEEDDEEVDNPFETSEKDSPTLLTARQVCNYIIDNMDLSPITDSSQPLCLETPMFLGHGTRDEKVKMTNGCQIAEILRSMGVREVQWKEYDEGHWYKVPDELDDIVEFLQGAGAC